MKKILIISHAYYPHIGGAEVAIKEITDRISRDDLSFDLVTLRFDKGDADEEWFGNVRIFRIDGNKYSFQFFAALKAFSLNKKYHYDALWALMAHSAGIPTLLAHWLTGLPYALTLQEGDPLPQIKRQMLPVYPLFKLSFTQAKVVQAISQYLGDWARDMGFQGGIHVVPNAVNTKYFSQKYTKKELDEVREKIGIERGNVYLITTSRLVHKNAVDDVIRALKLLGEELHFLVLGIGQDEEKLKALAEELGVEKRVHFLGQIDHKEMPKYLQVADIFIRPSRSEGMGNSFIEAMAAGIPVVATQEGGIADFLFDGETGFAVKKESPESIKVAVERILSNPEEVEGVVERAQHMAFEQYDWDLIAKRIKEEVFDRVL